MDSRRELMQDERRAIRMSSGVLLLVPAAAIAIAFEDVAIAVAVASFGLSMAVALFLVGERFGALRLELELAEAELGRAREAALIAALLESIDARLERIEQNGLRFRFRRPLGHGRERLQLGRLSGRRNLIRHLRSHHLAWSFSAKTPWKIREEIPRSVTAPTTLATIQEHGTSTR
jgi:hypothetical protein